MRWPGTHVVCLHPPVSDASGHGTCTYSPRHLPGATRPRCIVGEQVGRAIVYARPQRKMIALARIRDCEERNVICGDVTVFGEDGSVLSELTGARLRYIEEGQAAPASQSPKVADSFHRVVWQSVDMGRPATSLPGNWLLVSGDSTFRRALASEIAISGRSVTIVELRQFPPASEPGTGDNATVARRAFQTHRAWIKAARTCLNSSGRSEIVLGGNCGFSREVLNRSRRAACA